MNKEIVQIRYSYECGFYVYSLLREKTLWKSFRYADEFENKEEAYQIIRKQYEGWKNNE